MNPHLPECGKEFETDSCICEWLIACESRVREQIVSEFMSNHGDTATFNLGYDDALGKAEALIHDSWMEACGSDPCLMSDEYRCVQCMSYSDVLKHIYALQGRELRQNGTSSMSNLNAMNKVVGYINVPIDTKTLGLLCAGMDGYQVDINEDGILVIERSE